MSMSDAKKRANAKYNAKLTTWTIRLDPTYANEIDQYVRDTNFPSRIELIRRALDEYIQHHPNG